MDALLFLISAAESSLGVFLDIYSTRIFLRDLGVAGEANPIMRKMISKKGLKATLPIQIVTILILALIDSEFPFLLFWGLWFGVARGLVGLRNFQLITRYRVIGIERFREEQVVWRRMLLGSSTGRKIRIMLLPVSILVLCVICLFLVEDMYVTSILFALVSFYFAEIWYGMPRGKVIGSVDAA